MQFICLEGFVWSWRSKHPVDPVLHVEGESAHSRLLHQFLYNKWYFDELYNFLFVKPAFAIGRFLWKRGDEGTIDRFGPNGVAALVQGGTRLAVRLQSGYVYGYAFVMLLGLVGLASWAMVRFL